MMPVNGIRPQTPLNAPPPPSATPDTTPETISANWPEDRVDLSGMTVREAIAKVDEVRLEDLRQRIANGTYFTDAKLDYVADRVFEMLQTTKRTARSA